MGELAERIKSALHGVGWVWAGVISIALAVGSVALATAIVVAWAPDRFKTTDSFLPDHHPVLRVLGIIGKNLAGVLLIVLGIIMALPGVPGQGLLVTVIGVTLVNFPGKRRLELWCMRRQTLLRAINRLRARFSKPPLELD